MNIITLLNARSIFNQFGQTKIPSKLAYKIMKFCKETDVEEEFYNKRKSELIGIYAEKDENGQPIVNNGIVQLISDKTQEAHMAMQELNNTEVEEPKIKFTLAELDRFELSISDMYVLDAFIEE